MFRPADIYIRFCWDHNWLLTKRLLCLNLNRLQAENCDMRETEKFNLMIVSCNIEKRSVSLCGFAEAFLANIYSSNWDEQRWGASCRGLTSSFLSNSTSSDLSTFKLVVLRHKWTWLEWHHLRQSESIQIILVPQNIEAFPLRTENGIKINVIKLTLQSDLCSQCSSSSSSSSKKGIFM